MKISIVIPTYNDSKNSGKLTKYLTPCISSIILQSNFNEIELIVVANGCDFNTLRYLHFMSERYSNIKFIWNSEPLGYSKACNLGISIAKGEYVILLNDDTCLLNQENNAWINILKSGFEDEKVVITGPLPSVFHGRKFLIGFCLMVKKSFFDAHGLLDESFTPGWGEDIDLCLRAEKLGYKFSQVGIIKGENGVLNVGSFPIYHEGEATFHLYPDLVLQGQALHKKMIDRIDSGFYD